MTYPKTHLPSLKDYILLSFEGKILSNEDREKGLLILDGTWRLAKKMESILDLSHLERRSLPPHYQTAYPRRQEDCELPTRGLASVEALFLAYYLTERDTAGILDYYYWRDEFLKLNELKDTPK